MHEAFVSLTVAERWRRHKSFIYLENSILPANTISINCSMESTCLALARATAESPTTSKDFIFGTPMWGQGKAFTLVLLICIARSKSSTQLLGLKEPPGYAPILTCDLFWVLTTPLFPVYPASYTENPGVIQVRGTNNKLQQAGKETKWLTPDHLVKWNRKRNRVDITYLLAEFLIKEV